MVGVWRRASSQHAGCPPADNRLHICSALLSLVCAPVRCIQLCCCVHTHTRSETMSVLALLMAAVFRVSLKSALAASRATWLHVSCMRARRFAHACASCHPWRLPLQLLGGQPQAALPAQGPRGQCSGYQAWLGHANSLAEARHSCT